jgi:acetyl esterase
MFDTVVGRKVDLARLLGADVARSQEMQALFDWLVEQDKDVPDLNSLPIEEARRWRSKQTARTNAELPDVQETKRFTVPGIQGAPPVACELITPKGAGPGCTVFLHGGGWAYGDIDSHARLARMLAIETGRRLLYVDYRLAPETPYPGPLDDAVAAWRWAVAQAETQSDFKGPLLICGDSAGGNLALATMLREQEVSRRLPDLGLFFYGVFNDDFDSPSYERFATGFGLARAGMVRFWDMYAPSDTPGQPRLDATLCPVHASEAALARLPPLYFNASHLDPLLCDTVAMCNRLEAAGATFEVNIHEGVQHGFMQQSARLEEARRAFSLMGEFVRRHTGG